LEVSTYTLLNQLKTVCVFVIGVIFFKESLLLNKILGAGFIIIANAIVIKNSKKFKINRYIIIAITAALASSIALSIDVGISDLFNFPLYLMITFVVPIIILLIVERIKVSDIAKEVNSSNYNFYIITGVAWAFNSICFIRALQLGTVTIVAPLLAVTVLLNVLFAAIIHKERNNMGKKIFASVLTIIGIWLIVI